MDRPCISRRSRTSRQTFAAALFSVALLLCLCACAAPHSLDSADQEIAADGFAIGRIGVCGQESAQAAREFRDAGYLAVNLGGDVDAALANPVNRQCRFAAIVGAVDVDGLHQYGMRVLDMRTGQSLWSGVGPYGNDQDSLQTRAGLLRALRSMIADFAAQFPPCATPGGC